MYPVSAAFLAAVRSATMRTVSRVELRRSGILVRTVPFIEGVVDVDARRDGSVRDLTLIAAGDTAEFLDELETDLSVPGAELHVSRGLRLALADELVPLGVFTVDTLSRVDDGPIGIRASDRSVRISRNRWVDPYAVAAGVNVATALRNLLLNRWQGVPIGFSSADTAATVGAQIVLQAGASSDPWKDARAIATAAGLDLAFDGAGVAQLRRVLDPSIAPAMIEYAAGEMVISRTRELRLEAIYNGVIAAGEGSNVTTPVRAEVWDTDPNSSTYIEGPFGKAPRFYSSPLLTTESQCAAAASGIFAKLRGRQVSAAWTQVCNPAHEPLDVVSCAGVRYALDKLTVPLVASEAMTARARETYEAV